MVPQLYELMRSWSDMQKRNRDTEAVLSHSRIERLIGEGRHSGAWLSWDMEGGPNTCSTDVQPVVSWVEKEEKVAHTIFPCFRLEA